MMSLSQEWAILSKVMYGKKFVEELADFLKKQKVRTILECGCGDGNVLHGLAERRFSGLGIDASHEMISLAKKNNSHQNLSYKLMSWLDIWKLERKFDTIICRGNSLSNVVSWDRIIESLKPEFSKLALEKSIDLFMRSLRTGGLLYVDTISQREIDEEGGFIEVTGKSLNLKGVVIHDWKNRIRYVGGGGKINGETFYGQGSTYLISPDELESIIKNHNPQKIWRPKLKHEINYDIICARK
jgi:SAM-dependent methyltransferase